MDSGLLVYLSLVPRLLSSFLSHTATVCDKKVERHLGTRLVKGYNIHSLLLLL